MAAQQKRMLTAENSKLGKVDIVSALRKPESWTLLPLEVRAQLYALLPPPKGGEPAHDPDIHPLMHARFKGAIEEELRRWQEDLTEGREVKKWRAEAMKAGKDHVDGKFDEWKWEAREDYWGRPEVDDAGAKVEDGEGGMGDELAARPKVNGSVDGLNGVGETDEIESEGGKVIKDSEDGESELLGV